MYSSGSQSSINCFVEEFLDVSLEETGLPVRQNADTGSRQSANA